MSFKLKNLIADTRGATAIEYGLICSLIVLAALGAMNGVASETVGLWNTISSKSAEAHNHTGN